MGEGKNVWYVKTDLTGFRFNPAIRLFKKKGELYMVMYCGKRHAGNVIYNLNNFYVVYSV